MIGDYGWLSFSGRRCCVGIANEFRRLGPFNGDNVPLHRYREQHPTLGAGPEAYGPGACAAVTTKCVDFLNPASFAQPATGAFGNVGKGSLRFPGLFNWDMGLSKTFPFSERWKLQFRAEYFNVFNRVNYSSDDSTVSAAGNFNASSFGRLTSADDPRIGQLALKILF